MFTVAVLEVPVTVKVATPWGVAGELDPDELQPIIVKLSATIARHILSASRRRESCRKPTKPAIRSRNMAAVSSIAPSGAGLQYLIGIALEPLEVLKLT